MSVNDKFSWLFEELDSVGDIPKAISVSLGSSKRDKIFTVELFGTRSLIGRVGVNGDFKLAKQLMRILSSRVDAIGLGGIDLYLQVGSTRYVIKDARLLIDGIQGVPIADGSGLKLSLESYAIYYLTEKGYINPDMKVLMVSSVDRWGMAEAFWQLGYRCIFGDLIFGLGIDRPISSLEEVRKLASVFLKHITALPFELLYPVGSKQERRRSHKSNWRERYYKGADIIAGDFHFINRYLPIDLKGKVIITNTVTSENVAELRERGLEALYTTTPYIDGRSFGTNVLEACILALIRRKIGIFRDNIYEILLKHDTTYNQRILLFREIISYLRLKPMKVI